MIYQFYLLFTFIFLQFSCNHLRHICFLCMKQFLYNLMILIHYILLNIGTLTNAKSLPTSLSARSVITFIILKYFFIQTYFVGNRLLSWKVDVLRIDTTMPHNRSLKKSQKYDKKQGEIKKHYRTLRKNG